MEDRGITASVDLPTDWVSSMVVEPKKMENCVCVCQDPRPLNKALKRAHYPMPVIDDPLPSLVKARVFSVRDLRSGFWQISLDEEWGLCEYVIGHTILGGSPVILWISLGGKQNGFH